MKLQTSHSTFAKYEQVMIVTLEKGELKSVAYRYENVNGKIKVL